MNDDEPPSPRRYHPQRGIRMERRGPSHSGPFGLACMSCFTSKCRCVARPGSNGCERCHRLRRPCQPSDTGRRTATVRKKQDPSTRIAALESKLDGLIERLEARHIIESGDEAAQPQEYQHAAETPTQHRPDTADDEESSNNIATAQTGDDNGRTTDDGGIPFGRRSTSPRRTHVPTRIPDSLPNASPQLVELLLSESEAEARLNTFRTSMLWHFPFVHIPSQQTAQHLRRHRPFLLHAIVCVTSSSAEEREALSRSLREIICRFMFGCLGDGPPHPGSSLIRYDRMDLVIGLLVYIAWGWEHVLHGGSVSRLMAEAMALACELRLDKPISPAAQRMVVRFPHGFDESASQPGHAAPAASSRLDFIEQQRAVLGCFVLSSVVSICFGQVDALRWTPYMEDSLAAIGANDDCPNDKVLAVQVRLEFLAQKALQAHQQQQTEQGQIPNETTALPSLMSLMALEGQLQEIKTSGEPRQSPSHPVAQSKLLVAHIHATELSVHETTYSIQAAVPILVAQFSRLIQGNTRSNATGTAGSTSRHTAGKERTQSLRRCIHASKACVSALLTLAPTELVGISLVQWVQLARCILFLDHVTATIEDPAWDRAAARSVVDLPGQLDRSAEALAQAAVALGERRPNEALIRLSQAMRAFSTDVASSTAQEHRAAGEVYTSWSISQVFGRTWGSGIEGGTLLYGV